MTTTPGRGLPDVAALLRSRSYLKLLALAAVLGVPVSGFAYGFLLLVQKLQDWTFSDLPRGLGFHAAPVWWPVPILAVCGASVAAAIRYLPGTGGHSPAVGLVSGGPPVRAVQLPGVFFAAVATLGLGAVLGPEAPLIALGGGLAALAVRAGRDAPEHATLVVAAAGSFAAISTLLGSRLLGAFLLMEVSGLGGPTLGLVLLPGLLRGYCRSCARGPPGVGVGSGEKPVPGGGARRRITPLPDAPVRQW